jgi:hypothetical protein
VSYFRVKLEGHVLIDHYDRESLEEWLVRQIALKVADDVSFDLKATVVSQLTEKEAEDFQ